MYSFTGKTGGGGRAWTAVSFAEAGGSRVYLGVKRLNLYIQIWVSVRFTLTPQLGASQPPTGLGWPARPRRAREWRLMHRVTDF